MIGLVLTRLKIQRNNSLQVYYYIVENSEGANYFKINTQTGEISTKAIFDRETKAAYALEIEARDGAPSARPNSGGQPNSGRRNIFFFILMSFIAFFKISVTRLGDFESFWQQIRSQKWPKKIVDFWAILKRSINVKTAEDII